jgi:predicted Ser/Thr protein kinase
VTSLGVSEPGVCPSCGRQNPPDAHFCAGCGRAFGEPAPAARTEADVGGADPLLGRIVADRYRIEELLGRGGMGVVYRVEHIRIGKLMAMKLLHGALALDRDVVKRFQREAEAVSKLEHPNTVQVFDFGQSEGLMFLVMEFLSGRDLGQVVREDGPQPFERLARMAAQVASSVQQAHERGIIHRDLKPENIMVLEDAATPDYVKVLDFGLAKLRDADGGAERSITRAGSILGTPYYMAPEHIRGETVDARSDVYALGACLYKALTGEPPFTAKTPVGVLSAHLSEEASPPSARAPALEVPPEADAILMRCLAKDPAERFQSMAEVREALTAYLARVGLVEDLMTGRFVAQSAAAILASTGSGRQRRVATRNDVDRYERNLRRRLIVGRLVGVLLMLGLLGGAAAAYVYRPEPVEVAESEPNDTLVDADPLPADRPFEAYLGRRIDTERSDVDVYLLRNPRPGISGLRFEVTGLPNADLLVELYGANQTERPLLTADSAGVGGAEVVPNFAIRDGVHYLRVREVWVVGEYPTENVSDPYTVRWSYVDRPDGEERESNDSVERADRVALGVPIQGYIGWGGDRDVYCLEDAAPRVRPRVSGLPALDLRLEVTERGSGRAERVDEGGAGEGEIGPERAARAGSLCVEVSAASDKTVRNDPEHLYRFVFEVPEGLPDRPDPP